jgi:hypothetical protein
VAKITVGYFLEDIAHERFITALVTRIASEQAISAGDLQHDVRNATGGASIREFKQFLRDYAKGRESSFDVIVVAIDGNCTGYRKKRNQILELKHQVGYGGLVVCAVPDPHIERWYLADVAACQQAIGTTTQPQCPTYKCERKRYKQALTEAIQSTGVVSLLGGAEFGPQIIEAMCFYRAAQVDRSLGHFINDMRDAFASLAASNA